jgi:hypothetical protein
MSSCFSGQNGQYSGQYNQDPWMQRGYQTGYQNGVNAARNNKPMNMNTDDWHGQRLQAYRHGYQRGYNSVAGNRNNDGRNHDDDDH